MNNCDSIGMNIYIASMMIRRDLDSRFAKYGCTSGMQGRVLEVLAEAEKINQCIYQKDIEKLFGTRRSSVNNLIANLVSRGYVEKIPDPEDARLKKLQITDAGLLQYEKICNILDSFEASIAENYTPEEKDQLLSLLKRLMEHSQSTCENIKAEKEDINA